MVEFAGWVLRLPARALIGVANIILPGKGLKKGPFVTEEEILALASEAMEHSVIEESERDLIESIIDFGDTVVREIMVPRTDMCTIGADATVAECIDRAIDKGMSRIPVYGENTDDIEGIVYIKDAMRAEREGGADRCVQELVRPAMFVPETKRCAELLAEMQARRTHMAIVVDEYGGTAGLATLEDLLEELVGEITDEFDEEVPNVEELPNGDVLVNATLNVDDVNEELELELPEGNYDSLGGLVFELLGRVPIAGDSVEHSGVRLIVERVDGRRVVRVRLVRMEPSELADAEESGVSRPVDADGADESVPSDLDAMLAAAGIASDDQVPEGFRSGFVTFVGRPNVGKSTLLNQILGQKVSIVSDKPQTTRHQIRGVLNRPEAQIVFVDTPGIHKPRTLMGERLNDTATTALDGIDVACLLVEANASIGPGRPVRRGAAAQELGARAQQDRPRRARADHGAAVHRAEFGFAEYFPVSARTGQGRRRAGRVPAVPSARGPPVVPRGRGHRRARAVHGRRAGA